MTTTKHKVLTKSQIYALKSVAAEWDALDQNERARWGRTYTGFADWTVKMGRISTLHVLVSAGFVEVKYAEIVSNPMIRGVYGRWIGGTRRETHIEVGVRPTQLGRAVMASEVA